MVDDPDFLEEEEILYEEAEKLAEKLRYHLGRPEAIWFAAYLAAKGKLFQPHINPEDLPVRNFVMSIFDDAGIIYDDALEDIMQAWLRVPIPRRRDSE